MKKTITVSPKIIFFIIVFWLASLALSIGILVVATAGISHASDGYRQLRSFTDVLALVQRNYVEEVEISDLVDGAIRGMLLALDPHSSYLNKDTYKELQVETKGEFGGLGIEITVKDGILTVVSPIEDSPAYRAGVKAGDKIVKIGEEFSKDMTLIEAVKKMRGPRGTPITISVARKKYPGLIPITVVRDVIKVKSIRYRLMDSSYAYIRLSQFQNGSAAELEKAYKELSSKATDGKLKGLVLDLRSNPGGLLTEAVKVADLFVKEGILVYTDGRLETQKQKHLAHDDNILTEIPIVILVNEGSASASEIVAGALQDDGRAVILGVQTFGKGSVQTIIPMDDGAALRLTTALYYTKSGRSIQAEGITPDVEVKLKEQEEDEQLAAAIKLKAPREKDLRGAIQNPNGNKAGKVEKKEPKEERLLIGSRKAMTADLKELLAIDNQLEEALNLLKTWHVFKGKPTMEAKKKNGIANSNQG